MRNRLFELGCLCALISGTGALAAEPTICPATISTHQQLASAVAGWDSFVDDLPQLLSAVTFFDGAPEEKASLVYDKIVKMGGKQIATWTFEAQKTRKIWLACRYSGTAITLKSALPDTTRVCTVTYSLKEQIAGMESIEKIVCK
ncbi:MAG TPA: STY0301 family protein [Bryobacteraceae bacterium]|jgi:hypothetical protein